MLKQVMVAVVAAVSLCGCTSNRGGLADGALDAALYRAETKSERLLRDYEVQALLIRYAAENAGSHTDRGAISLANVHATEKLLVLLTCLQKGAATASLDTKLDPANVGNWVVDATSPVAIVRGSEAYCSFFDSRLLAYEDALWSLMRQIIRDDADALTLKQVLSGPEVGDVWAWLTRLFTIASRAIRDERVLNAFRADAWELEVLVHSEVPAPECVSANRSYLGVRPERSNAGKMKAALDGVNYSSTDPDGPLRPSIRVWHFREVSAFMVASCRALDGDTVVSTLDRVNCSKGVPYRDASYKSCKDRSTDRLNDIDKNDAIRQAQEEADMFDQRHAPRH